MAQKKKPAKTQHLAAQLKELKRKEAQYPILMVVLCEGGFHESYRFKTVKAADIFSAGFSRGGGAYGSGSVDKLLFSPDPEQDALYAEEREEGREMADDKDEFDREVEIGKAATPEGYYG